MDEVVGGPLREAPPGDERREAARQLLEAFYRQVLTEGFFHADPHPGNLLWSEGRIYLLDLGMVGIARRRHRAGCCCCCCSPSGARTRSSSPTSC